MTTLRIDPGATLPPYEQLRTQLLEHIASGALPEETRLPAVRRLAADLGIAPGTVARAYRELETQGYLVTRGRHGTIVARGVGGEQAPHIAQLSAQFVAQLRALGLDDEAIITTVHRTISGH